MVQVEFFAGAAMQPHLSALARLRMAVFRDWPYLYEGDEQNEATYMAALATWPRAGLAVALDGAEAVGCSTCVPLVDEDEAVIAPIRARGWNPENFFYFGESVLLPAYRGQGIGVAFFRERERHAKAVSACDFATFCAVQRPADHPQRPAGAVPLDAFWRKRGFVPYPDLFSTMSWKQVGSEGKVTNRLTYWMKSLHGAPLP